MTTASDHQAAALERLSALGDGELNDESAVTEACRTWRGDASLRASWHAYQLIGDVLRSDDLGTEPAADARFLAELRSRLADEPVVLAPAAPRDANVVNGANEANEANGRFSVGSGSAAGRRRSWMTPVAVAAGFVAVVGVVALTGGPAGSGTSPALASGHDAEVRTASSASTVPMPTAAATLPAADAHAQVASVQLIRDVRLDRYLSAHKEFAGSSALGVPSGFLRNATADAADR